MNVYRRMAALTVTVLVIGVMTATAALANGVPVRLFLNYLPETSNWGPQTASGEAVVGVGDGFVQLTVTGLPRLEEERYTVWLIPRGGDGWLRIGDFNMEAGTTEGNFGWSPEEFPYQEYRLIILTVEPEPDADGAPNSRISLVGHFPNPEVAPASPVSEEGGTGGATQEQPPPRLPVTGGETVWPFLNLGTALLIIVTSLFWLMVGLGGWLISQRRQLE